jgi:N-acetylneuraminic acid mutarotase
MTDIKNSILLFISAMLASFAGSAQDFTWMKGSNFTNQPGTYGTMGVPSSNTNPGIRRGAGTWTDNNGNLWLYGGEGYATSTSVFAELADLWKYDPSTNQWTWMHGTNTMNSLCVYGTQGVAAPGNRPGGRRNMVTWTDANGDLWLFGGYGWYGNSSFGFTNPQNDLWRYNIATNEWTWMKGGTGSQQYGIYGTQGVGAPANLPGERYGSVGWADNNGNLWMFGGYGQSYTISFGGEMNDLWRYNIASGNWAWMKGSTTGSGATAVFGTQGAASSANTPGGRETAVAFNDNLGNFWLFGGWGITSSVASGGRLNDLWRYNPSTNQWTWMKGANTVNPYSIYGPQGVSTSTAVPGGRQWSHGWTDAAGDLWIFGGEGYNATTLTTRLADFWRYQPSTNQWTWVTGSQSSNISPTFGTQTVPSSSNFWGSRQNSAKWNSATGLWIFGGMAGSSGYLNDLWRYDVCYTPPQPSGATPSANLSVCGGNSATLSALTSTGVINWFTSPTATTVVGTGTTFVTPPLSTNTIYYAEVMTCGPSASRIAFSTTVHPLPQIFAYGGGICPGNSFTINPSGANSYSFSGGSNVVSPAVTSTFSITGTSTAGCESAAAFVVTVTVGNTLSVSVTGSNVICTGASPVFTANGAATYSWSTGSQLNTIQVAPPVTATYTLTGYSGTCISTAVHSLTVLPVPTVIVNSGAICIGSSFTLNSSGASSYTILPTTGLIVTPSVSTVYSVTGTGANGCVSPSPALANVLVNNLPVVTAGASTTSVCFGNTVSLIGGGAHTYTWTGNQTNGVPFTLTTTSGYFVSGTNTLTGCSSTNIAAITINVKALPPLTAIVSPSLICLGESAQLNAYGGASVGWVGLGNDPSYTVSPESSTDYIVTATANGCQKTLTISLTVDVCESVKSESQIVNLSFSNPSKSTFMINLSGASSANLNVFNMAGQNVLSRSLSGGANEICSGLPPGTYLLFVLSDERPVQQARLLIVD